MKLSSLLLGAAMLSLQANAAAPLAFLDVMNSPVILGDSIVFRVAAPNASSVSLTGQFMQGSVAMSRNDKGVWSVTVPTPTPDIYPYNFIIDGISVADPGNINIFPNESFKASMLEIPDDNALYTVRDVPHGKIHYNTYKSDVLGQYRNLIVYTPAEYEANPDKSYPVFYLVSGTTDTEEVWFKVGRANTLLDNLIASGEAEPMIVVMPYGYMNNGTPRPSSPEAAKMYQVFVKELTQSIMPYVESNYRTINNRDSRAIAGFSRGGGQSMFTAFSCPDKFGWLESYSAYLTPEVIDAYFPNIVKDANSLNSLWMCVGTSDFLYNDVVRNKRYFDDKAIKYQAEERGGSHTWMHARYCLANSLRRLFRK